MKALQVLASEECQVESSAYVTESRSIELTAVKSCTQTTVEAASLTPTLSLKVRVLLLSAGSGSPL